MESREPTRTRAGGVPSSFVLAVAIVALVASTVALTMTVTHTWTFGTTMMGGTSMMRGWTATTTGPAANPGPAPGAPGFVAGTDASPRVVSVFAGPGASFTPSTVVVQRGETITFQVTTMGPTSHEFMVGPADAVARDAQGTPEIAGIAMMQTKSITYRFDGAGPYAFACHVAGHYEAGMRGAISVVAP